MPFIRRFALGFVCSLTLSLLSGSARSQVVHEVAKLLPSDLVADAHFGESVSVSGNVAVAGASHDNDNGFQSGSAYVFRWDGSTWAYEEKLLPPDGGADDWFGYSVSLSGDVALVGAYRDNDQGPDSGSAYVFRWNGSTWAYEEKLLPPDGETFDYFGNSVSASGDVALVGAFADNNGIRTNSGSAYVFRWNGSTWAYEGKLLPPDGAAGDYFGNSVSVSGDVALVGASFENNDGGAEAGSAYVFRWNGLTWEHEQKLLNPDGAVHLHFGICVSVWGDVAAVGTNTDIISDHAAGSAYVFRWNGSTWEHEQKLMASDAAEFDHFGYSLSVSGDVAVVGAPHHLANNYAGSAYVFRWNGSTWLEETVLRASDGATDDFFGGSVSVSGNVAVAGAPYDDNNATNTGSTYVFNLYCDPGYYGPLCLECPGGASNPCNGQAKCDDGVDGSGVCLCDDGLSCTEDTFDTEKGECIHQPNDAVCDDGFFCNGAEVCNPALGCESGTSVNCDDAIGCTIDSCDESSDACANTYEASICGTCCATAGLCVEGRTTEECPAGGVFVQGAACQGVAACCLPDESCIDVDATCCQAQGGIPDSAGFLCDDEDFFGCVVPIPTVSEWGLVVLTLLTLVGAKLAFRTPSTGAGRVP